MNPLVLIDGYNFQQRLKPVLSSGDWWKGLGAFLDLLREQYGEVDAVFYRAVYKRVGGMDGEYRRVREALRSDLAKVGVEPRLFNQPKRPTECRCGRKLTCATCGNEQLEPEKCVDVAITVDAVAAAHSDPERLIILVTNDSDFSPLLSHLVELTGNIKLYCENKISRRLEIVCSVAEEEHNVLLREPWPEDRIRARLPQNAVTQESSQSKRQRRGRIGSVARKVVATLKKVITGAHGNGREKKSSRTSPGQIREYVRSLLLSGDSIKVRDLADALESHFGNDYHSQLGTLDSGDPIGLESWIKLDQALVLTQDKGLVFVARSDVQAWKIIAEELQDHGESKVSGVLSRLKTQGHWDSSVKFGYDQALQFLEAGAEEGFFALRRDHNELFLMPRSGAAKTTSVSDIMGPLADRIASTEDAAQSLGEALLAALQEADDGRGEKRKSSHAVTPKTLRPRVPPRPPSRSDGVISAPGGQQVYEIANDLGVATNAVHQRCYDLGVILQDGHLTKLSPTDTQRVRLSFRKADKEAEGRGGA